VLLLIIVVAQSFYLFRMHGRVEVFTGDKQSESDHQLRQEAQLPQEPNSFWPDDEWWNMPFDPNTWDPFSEMEQMQERMNSIFHNAFGRFERSPRFGNLYREPLFSPKLDLTEEKDHYIVRIDLPGTEEAKVDIQIDGQTLRIKGEREELIEKSDEDGHVIQRERRLGHFDRSISLPGPVDDAKMTTNYEDGILTIILPKAID